MKYVKVHKITMMVIDHDDIGVDEAAAVIENQRYPNHCIYPRVMSTETARVDWSDAHPLNHTNTQAVEFARLFPEKETH